MHLLINESDYKCFKAVSCDMIIDRFLLLCSARLMVLDILPHSSQIRNFFYYTPWIMESKMPMHTLHSNKQVSHKAIPRSVQP